MGTYTYTNFCSIDTCELPESAVRELKEDLIYFNSAYVDSRTDENFTLLSPRSLEAATLTAREMEADASMGEPVDIETTVIPVVPDNDVEIRDNKISISLPYDGSLNRYEVVREQYPDATLRRIHLVGGKWKARSFKPEYIETIYRVKDRSFPSLTEAKNHALLLVQQGAISVSVIKEQVVGITERQRHVPASVYRGNVQSELTRPGAKVIGWFVVMKNDR